MTEEITAHSVVNLMAGKLFRNLNITKDEATLLAMRLEAHLAANGYEIEFKGLPDLQICGFGKGPEATEERT